MGKGGAAGTGCTRRGGLVSRGPGHSVARILRRPLSGGRGARAPGGGLWGRPGGAGAAPEVRGCSGRTCARAAGGLPGREAGPWLCGPLRTPWQCEQPLTGAEPACPGSRENQNACRRQGLEPWCPRRGRSAPPARTPLRDAAGGRQPARGPGPVSGAPGRACRGGSVSGPAHRPVRASKGRRHERGAVRMRCHPAWASTGMPGVCSHLVRALPSAPLRVRMGTGAVGRKQAGLTGALHAGCPHQCSKVMPAVGPRLRCLGTSLVAQGCRVTTETTPGPPRA